jgi:hypothetical protein
MSAIDDWINLLFSKPLWIYASPECPSDSPRAPAQMCYSCCLPAALGRACRALNYYNHTSIYAAKI